MPCSKVSPHVQLKTAVKIDSEISDFKTPVFTNMDLIMDYLPKTEEEFLIAMEVVHVIGAIGTLITAIHPIPYGRYSSHLKLTGWTISAQTLWRVRHHSSDLEILLYMWI